MGRDSLGRMRLILMIVDWNLSIEKYNNKCVELLYILEMIDVLNKPGFNELTNFLYISLIAFSSFSVRLLLASGTRGSITLAALCDRIESIVVDSFKHSRKSLLSSNVRKSSLEWFMAAIVTDLLDASAAIVETLPLP